VIGRPSGRALLLGAVATLVAGVVGVAVLVVDSPAEERRRRLDERRVADLTELAGAIDSYRAREGVLPADLDALAGWQGFDPPAADPETAAPYRYRITGERTYELCATFVTATQDRRPRPVRSRRQAFWHHPAGDHCFVLEAKEVER
jgi:hypothetical protein